MEKFKMIKESLMSQIYAQMGNLQNVDTKELGEAIDMIKDLEEAMYYCSIVKAMEESQEEKKYASQYYSPMMAYNNGGNNRMYYDGGNSSNGGGNSGGNSGNRSNYSSMYYEDERYPLHLQPHEASMYLPAKMQQERDSREGRSPINRRKYMESKSMHKDDMTQRKELEEYMNELSRDIIEMISDATPDQKVLLAQKLNTLASKVQ